MDISEGTKEMMVFFDPAGKVPTQGLSLASDLLAQFLKSLSSFLQMSWVRLNPWTPTGSFLTEMIPGANIQVGQLAEVMGQWSLPGLHNTRPSLGYSLLSTELLMNEIKP